MAKQRWFEDYSCGCVSESVERKRDLLGYCAVHGNERRYVWPESMESETVIKRSGRGANDG
jgi:hypothetical protein